MRLKRPSTTLRRADTATRRRAFLLGWTRRLVVARSTATTAGCLPSPRQRHENEAARCNVEKGGHGDSSSRVPFRVDTATRRRAFHCNHRRLPSSSTSSTSSSSNPPSSTSSNAGERDALDVSLSDKVVRDETVRKSWGPPVSPGGGVELFTSSRAHLRPFEPFELFASSRAHLRLFEPFTANGNATTVL